MFINVEVQYDGIFKEPNNALDNQDVIPVSKLSDKYLCPLNIGFPQELAIGKAP